MTRELEPVWELTHPEKPRLQSTWNVDTMMFQALRPVEFVKHTLWQEMGYARWVGRIAQDLIQNSKPLEPDIAKIVNDNFWDIV